ncbi:ABC transporter permease [Aureitalea marina]|uniref:ABC transporter permease n=1 Tax=Aureitalea marina TaxID=930804 RepID=A0A2S7KNJ8_9FLAO|nr:ABC transporter permease [Aureitalea marina]PQB04195.1 ABC transporter permease [Aureitalea marina]
MTSLINIEIFKLLKQKRTYLAIVAIFVFELVVLWVAHDQGKAILDTLLDRLKDTFYFSGELLNGNLITYLLLNSLWFHLPLILMIIVSGMMCSEYEDGTLRAVLLQPISRWQFLMSKYLVASLFTIIVVLFLGVTAIGFSHLLFGGGDLVVYFERFTFFDQTEALRRLGLAFVAGSVTMVFYTVVSMTLAVLFKQTIKTWIVAAVFLVCSNLLVQVDLGSEWLNLWFFPKLTNTWQEFFVTDIDWSLIGVRLMVLTVYTLLAASVGFWIFNRREIG